MPTRRQLIQHTATLMGVQAAALLGLGLLAPGARAAPAPR
ncbi:agmatine deiminase, partial [Achromobacter xylosoxidans]